MLQCPQRLMIRTLAILAFLGSSLLVVLGLSPEEDIELYAKNNLLSVHEAEMPALFEEGIVVHYGEQDFQFIPRRKDLAFVDGVWQFNEPFMHFMLNSMETALNQKLQNIELLDDGLSGSQEGVYVLMEAMESKLQTALTEGRLDVDAQVQVVAPTVENRSSFAGKMSLLSTGISNFEGSDLNRIFNIERGLSEYMNGKMILPGEEFSFNESIGGKELEYSDGWKPALGIFGAEDLEYIPGGGICQVSTTMYRAALGAGLDIVDQRNHSLWVNYYGIPADKTGTEGHGLDATIYPGIQDLSFVNNTDSPIWIEAYRDGNDAIVNFYGKDDGRRVEFEGPYNASNYSEEAYAAFDGPLGLGDILWKQSITWADGQTEVRWLHSKYHSPVPQR